MGLARHAQAALKGRSAASVARAAATHADNPAAAALAAAGRAASNRADHSGADAPRHLPGGRGHSADPPAFGKELPEEKAAASRAPAALPLGTKTPRSKGQKGISRGKADFAELHR